MNLGSFCLAGAANSEILKTMAIYAELRHSAKLARLLRQIAIRHIHNPPALGANEMMVVAVIAEHVAVAAIYFVHSA